MIRTGIICPDVVGRVQINVTAFFIHVVSWQVIPDLTALHCCDWWLQLRLPPFVMSVVIWQAIQILLDCIVVTGDSNECYRLLSSAFLFDRPLWILLECIVVTGDSHGDNLSRCGWTRLTSLLVWRVWPVVVFWHKMHWGQWRLLYACWQPWFLTGNPRLKPCQQLTLMLPPFVASGVIWQAIPALTRLHCHDSNEYWSFLCICNSEMQFGNAEVIPNAFRLQWEALINTK